MKILSLNICHGGGKRAPALLDSLFGRAPDVVVLPEWRNNAVGQGILKSFNNRGFLTATATREGPGANGILIAACEAFYSQRITPGASPAGELLLADLPIGLRILAAYFPQGHWKEPFFRACIDEASRAGATPMILIGDLNTGRNDLDIEGDGTPFHCAQLFESLESRAGLIDLWRATPGNGELREWTWRSTANGSRIDHAFGNKPLVEGFAQIHSHYDHVPRQTRISDHSALFVESSESAHF